MPTLVDADPAESLIRAFERRRPGDPAALAAAAPPAGAPGRVRVLTELIRVDLEFGWDAGRPRPLTDYLAAYPDLAADPAAVAAVAFEEYRQRLDRGDPPSAAEYAAAFGVDVAGWPAADSVADAASDYRRFRAGSSAGRFPARTPAAELFQSLHAADPATADRLAAGLAAFPEPGAALGPFRLGRELGRGAFARVYLAHQDDLAGRPVALKVTAAWSGECQTLARLQHTHIVPVHSVHAAGGLFAVCMPYFGATTLADVARARRGRPASGAAGSTVENRLSRTRTDAPPAPPAADRPEPARFPHLDTPDGVLWLVGRLADGLAHAHDRGVVHRDLKPANVLLTDDGVPMLLDFNLAAGPAAAAAARVGGTLPYMAPEQLAAFHAGSPDADPRGDLYALGLIAYELLAGRPAFPTVTGPIDAVIPAMIAARAAGPPDVRRANPAVSPAAGSIVAKCLAADPAERYQTAAALRDDIGRHLAHLPLRHAPNPSTRERLAKWARRNPRASSGWTVGAAAALVLAAAGVAGWGAHADAARLRATEQAAAFARAKDTLAARLSFGLLDPAKVAPAVAAGEELLARYAAATDPDWATRPAVTRLAGPDRAALKAAVGEALFLTARAADKAGRPADAAAWTRRAVACYPPGEVPAAVAAQAAALAGVPVDPALSAAVPDDGYLAAADLIGQGRYKAALPFAARAAAAAPARLPARFLHGVCLLRTGQGAAAAAEFDVCLALDPDHGYARSNRGLARHQAGDPAAAEADFDAVLAARPADPDALLSRGLCRQDQGDTAGALADFATAVATGAAPARVYFVRARLYARLGDPAAAARDLAAGEAARPADAVSFSARAVARRAADPAGAAADFRAAAALDPDNPRYGVGLAGVLADDLRDTAAGVAALTRVLADHPTYPAARVGRAVLHARGGDRAAAHADAAAARAAPGGADPVMLYQLAGVYALTARTAPADRPTAVKLLAQAFAADPATVDLFDADPDIDPVRADPAVQELVAAARRVTAAAGQ